MANLYITTKIELLIDTLTAGRFTLNSSDVKGVGIGL